LRLPAPLNRFLEHLRLALAGQAVEYIEAELRQLETVFATLVLGSLAGMPTPLSGAAARLAPYMLPEIMAMLEEAGRLDDLIGEIGGLFEPT